MNREGCLHLSRVVHLLESFPSLPAIQTDCVCVCVGLGLWSLLVA